MYLQEKWFDFFGGVIEKVCFLSSMKKKDNVALKVWCMHVHSNLGQQIQYGHKYDNALFSHSVLTGTEERLFLFEGLST